MKAEVDAKIANGLDVFTTEAIQIEFIEWQNIEHLIIARSRGSEGVFIISDHQDRAVVIKAMVNPAHSFFASQVLSYLGIRVPDQQVISTTDKFDEYKLLMHSVDWATKHHPANRGLAKQAFAKQLLLVQEYIPGLQVDKMTKERCTRFFNLTNLIDVGKTIVFDLALNNSDRFPIHQVWQNANGNAFNMIFKV